MVYNNATCLEKQVIFICIKHGGTSHIIPRLTHQQMNNNLGRWACPFVLMFCSIGYFGRMHGNYPVMLPLLS